MAECLGSLFRGYLGIVSRISGAPRLNRGLKYEPKPLPHSGVGPKTAQNGQKQPKMTSTGKKSIKSIKIAN